MNDSRFLSFRRHEKTNQIHIHFHIFAFPPILQISTTGSNRAPDAPPNCVATQRVVRPDAVGITSGRSWGYVGTQLERQYMPYNVNGFNI